MRRRLNLIRKYPYNPPLKCFRRRKLLKRSCQTKKKMMDVSLTVTNFLATVDSLMSPKTSLSRLTLRRARPTIIAHAENPRTSHSVTDLMRALNSSHSSLFLKVIRMILKKLRRKVSADANTTRQRAVLSAMEATKTLTGDPSLFFILERNTLI